MYAGSTDSLPRERSAATVAVPDPTQMSTTPHMDTRAPNRTTEPPTPGTPSFALANAQRTFDPFNTADCPKMFADKWTTDEN